jgi:D-amino peptidase
MTKIEVRKGRDRMKVLISSDMEGVSGIDEYRQVLYFHPEFYENARVLLTEDINAVVRGLQSVGATEIDVIDGHGGGVPPYNNILKDRIAPGVRVMAGFDVGVVGMLRTARSLPLDPYDAQVLVGYHAMAGTIDGFMSHTASTVTAVRINGRFVGETEMSAYGAGLKDVPTILVTGDAAVVREAKHFLPGIEGAIVKTASSRNNVKCLPLDESHSVLEKAAADSLESLKKFEPSRLRSPIHLDVVLSSPELASMAATVPRSRLVDDRTISYVAQEYGEAIDAFATIFLLATTSSQFILAKQVLGKSEEAKKNAEQLFKELYHRWMTEPPPFQSERILGL